MSATTESITLTVYGRQGTGHSASYRVRQTGLVPGVVYGPKMKSPMNIAVKPNEVRSAYLKAGHTTLVTLEVGEGAPSELKGAKILFKELQQHPVKLSIEHIDLHQLDLSRKIRVTVPLNYVGKAKGLAEGGLLSISSREIEIKSLPQDIPNHIDVDISELGLNDTLHIEDFVSKTKHDKYEFIFDSNFSLISCVEPEEETAAPVAAAAAPGTPAAPGAAGATPAAGAPAAAAPAAAAKAPAKK